LRTLSRDTYALRWSVVDEATTRETVGLSESSPYVLEVQATRAAQRWFGTPPANDLRAALDELRR
jgi:hypothetical protein